MSGLPARVQDVRGDRFGRLTVESYVGPHQRGVKSRWLCHCDCGQETIVAIDQLRRGKTKSCGCFRAEATRDRRLGSGNRGGGDYKGHPAEYFCRINIVSRCQNPLNKDFKSYGGRGITVCSRWLHGENGKSGFDCFLEDMGPRPDPKLSIDRINNHGNYEPGNCRCATWTEQANNTRRKKK
jgi:hypothetical protein